MTSSYNLLKLDTAALLQQQYELSILKCVSDTIKSNVNFSKIEKQLNRIFFLFDKLLNTRLWTMVQVEIHGKFSLPNLVVLAHEPRIYYELMYI